MSTSPSDTSPDAGSFTSRPNAKRWQLQVADDWLATARDPTSMRERLAAQFSEGVQHYFQRSIDLDANSEQIIEHLISTLTRCDVLAFDDDASALSYLLWHQVDRYHRVIQALDMLLARGALPVAKRTRSLKVLEVGSGPAPASYATVDYFAALGGWSQSESENFHVSRLVETHTLDRGRAWERVVHGLSEQLASDPFRSRVTRFFGLTYNELSGFDPRRIHSSTRDDNRERIMSGLEEDGFLMWPGDSVEIDRHAAAMAPPSGYDLIIVANFLTNREMMTSLSDDLEALARSLTPGGVLLTLSGTSSDYKEIWADFARLKSVRRLRHVIDEVVRAHPDDRIRRRVAEITLTSLRALESATGRDIDEGGIPTDILRALRATGTDEAAAIADIKYPRFQVHAYKNEGNAIPLRDRIRVARRKGD